MMKLLALCGTVLLLSACTNAVTDLKSPCVGGKGSPCERRAVNNAA